MQIGNFDGFWTLFWKLKAMRREFNRLFITKQISLDSAIRKFSLHFFCALAASCEVAEVDKRTEHSQGLSIC